MNGAFLASRRRTIARNGRAMVLRRIGVDDLPLTGTAHTYTPQQLLGGIMQGDLRIEILNDEIVAAFPLASPVDAAGMLAPTDGDLLANPWPTPIRKPDVLVVDGKSMTVQGATPIHEQGTVIGWSIWVRG